MSERKVWVVDLPAHYEYEDDIGQVMIEQFDDAPPTIAFRSSPHKVWGAPHASTEAP